MLRNLAARAYTTARPFVERAGQAVQFDNFDSREYYSELLQQQRKVSYNELRKEQKARLDERLEAAVLQTRLQFDLGCALVEVTCARANMNPLSALEIITGTLRAHVPFEDKNDVQLILNRIVSGELDTGLRSYAAARGAIIDRFSDPDLYLDSLRYYLPPLDNTETDPERAATASLIDTAAKSLHAALSRPGRITSKFAPGYDTPCVRIRERSEAEVRALESGRHFSYEDDDPEMRRWGCEPMYGRGCSKAEILKLCTLTRAEGMVLCTFLRFADLNIGVDYSTADGKGFQTFWHCPWHIK
ncbi:hypothetical protein GGX14DRAFT_661265 [Mycena pura]|uniref:Uncharacterized protein n=1 Tax=Mycena pura TaxID=153505 RepID=A0AAD6V0L8_9AGAR|nr:hypothetical protein GGX14DRAFT_661265 [Mycena pura]